MASKETKGATSRGAGAAPMGPNGSDPDHLATALELYRGMVLVREVELRIETLHQRGQISGSFHSSLGQEACAVGVCSQLRPSDRVTSTHRGHGHALAKGVPAEGVMAELYGRESGVCGGRGGSMHLHHRPSGFLGQNAIVGGGLPWAAGSAWARRRGGSDDITVAFTGDGGVAQGSFHETLVLVRAWKSPLLVVCENNGLAHSMPVERVFGPPGSISEWVAARGITASFVDGRDVLTVAEVCRELIEVARGGEPAFLECEVFRVRPHSIADPDYRYREKDAGDQWMAEHDAVARLRGELEPVAAEQLERIEREVGAEVDAAAAAAEAAEPTSTDAARRNVYTAPDLQDRV